MATPRAYVNTQFVSREAYRNQLDKIIAHGVCPLCAEHLPTYHTGPILLENKSWTITPNDFPYANTERQILFILRRHEEEMSNLTAKEWADLQAAVNWTIKKFAIPGGALTMRFGASTLSGASIHHLHAHIIVPQTNEDGSPKLVTFKVGG